MYENEALELDTRVEIMKQNDFAGENEALLKQFMNDYEIDILRIAYFFVKGSALAEHKVKEVKKVIA